MERKRLELSTSALRTQESTNVSVADKGLVATPAGVCTRVCTGEAKNAHADLVAEDLDDRLEGIAAELRKLSPAERAKLVAMLTQDGGEG